MSPRWNIHQLAEAVRLGLETGSYRGQDSGRVRDVPDERSIRYYTTIGLLDRPMEIRGRTAYYGRRHLLQLVAIKRLQARGLTLLQVQQALLGADDDTLARWATLPDKFWRRAVPEPQPDLEPQAADAQSVRRENRPWPGREKDFWGGAPDPPRTDMAPAEPSASPWLPQQATHLRLAPGVEIVLEGIDPGEMTWHKLAELAPAAENLVRALRVLGLVRSADQSSGESRFQQPSPSEEEEGLP